MALLKNKVTFIAAVAEIIAVDMGVQTLVFPKSRTRVTSQIEYDYAVVNGASAAYHSFAQTANVVQKDGKSVVTLDPINFNESISKEAVDANMVQFGQNEYSIGAGDVLMESLLTGVGKLALRAEVGLKVAYYDALVNHQITGGNVSRDGVASDIVFNVPAAQKAVLTNTGSELYWDNASAKPVTNIYDAYASMKVKPSMGILQGDTYGLFYASGEVRTADNSSTGKKANFILNENVDTEADFYRAGTLMEKDMRLDIYVERGTYDVAGTDTDYMSARHMVFAQRGAASTEYAGIPVAEKGGVRMISAEMDVSEVVTENPPVHEFVFRTAPLPVLKRAMAFYSLRVKA